MDRERLITVLREYGILLLSAGVGITLLGYGLWQAITPEPAKVEIVASEVVRAEEIDTSEILVDVSGAVEKPGVYHLPVASRIGDAVVRAGGLSSEADRQWVARYVNLAQVVEDGAKIYIPDTNNLSMQQTGSLHSSSNDQGVTSILGIATDSSSNKININTASMSELDSLWGIGEARAGDIIANRPYGSIEELTTKAKVPKNVFEKMKDQISVY